MGYLLPLSTLVELRVYLNVSGALQLCWSCRAVSDPRRDCKGTYTETTHSDLPVPRLFAATYGPLPGCDPDDVAVVAVAVHPP